VKNSAANFKQNNCKMKKNPTDFISSLLKEMDKKTPFNEDKDKKDSVQFEDVDDDIEDQEEETEPRPKAQKKTTKPTPSSQKKEQKSVPTKAPTAKLFDSDMDLKTIDLLTQKLVQEMGGDFGDDDDDDDDLDDADGML
jgi:hypothetical protein